MESHIDPDNAPSDGPNMIPLEQMPALLGTLARIAEASKV
jgi:2-dehydro-3-deoxyphosphooctonate aldolase (KDO 8-P synthase)